ncbi:hypothetical protein V6N12_059678 [Hibiscus sabdariffa]|uniref:RRM domain-containing protein n=1 Tax=Hibiscus sabdariffa TaxID=183260 RepID=A0ABR2EVS2_9ROSI
MEIEQRRKTFDFVSFGEDSDAARVIERLDGFNVYGYRLTIKVANQKNGFIGSKTNDVIGNKTNKVGGGADMDAAEGIQRWHYRPVKPVRKSEDSSRIDRIAVKKLIEILLRSEAEPQQPIENLKGLLGEKEKSVSINLISAPKIVGENKKKYGNEAVAQELDMGQKIRNWAAVVSVDSKNRSEDGVGLIQKYSPVVDVSMGLVGEKNLEPDSVEVATVSLGDADITTPRACDDVRDMGLLPNLLATDSIPEMRKSLWAEEVDKRMNARYSKGDPDQGDLETVMDKNEEETFRDFFPEMSQKSVLKL